MPKEISEARRRRIRELQSELVFDRRDGAKAQRDVVVANPQQAAQLRAVLSENEQIKKQFEKKPL